MKKIITAFTLASVLSLISTPALSEKYTVNEKTDEFSGISELSTSIIPLNLARSVQFIKLNDTKQPGLQAVIFKYYRDSANDKWDDSKRWLFLKDRVGYLLIDGESYYLGQGMYSNDTVRKGGLHLIEIVAFTIKPEVLSKLSTATTVKGKVGNSEFILTSEQLSTIIDFATKAI